ncbi:unnamed protein product [Boreogadus saida]
MRFCICGGCSNSDVLSDHLRFHSFPDRRKDGAGFRAWVHFVQPQLRAQPPAAVKITDRSDIQRFGNVNCAL